MIPHAVGMKIWARSVLGVYTGFAEKNMKALEFEDEVMVSKKRLQIH